MNSTESKDLSLECVSSLETSSSKCSKTVTKSKYERLNPDTQKWWKRTFQLMEEKYKIPPHERPEVISRIYPKKLLSKILNIVESKPDLKLQTREFFPAKESTETLYSSDKVRPFGEGMSCESIVVGQMKLEEKVSEEIEEEEEEYEILEQMKKVAELADFEKTQAVLLAMKSEESIEEEMKESWDESISRPMCEKHVPLDERPKILGNENPYLDFFKKKEERAAIWRTVPPLEPHEMNLSQKANYLVDQIAEEFIAWLETIGAMEMIDLNKQTLIKMFQFSFEIGHAAASLKVCMKELKCVTEDVAEVYKMDWISERSTILKYINQDIQKSKLPPRQRAFGTTLPIQMRRTPIKEDLHHKWFVCKNVPPKLADMAVVWEGITHLRSVRTFCQWLLTQDMPVLPKYLQNEGLLDENYYKDLISVESYVSEGGAEMPPSFKITDFDDDEI